MGEETSNAVSTAEAGIKQASAEGQSSSAAPAESGTGAPQSKTAAENPFASEDAELETLLATVEAETKAGATKGGEKPAGATDGTGTSEAPTGAQQPGGEKPAADAAKSATVEDAAAAAAQAGRDAQTAAIVALRKQGGDLKNALLIKEGENRALRAMLEQSGQGGQSGEGDTSQAQPTAEEQELAELAQERVRLAEEVDAGRMSMKEYAVESNKLGERERILTLTIADSLSQREQEPVNDLGLQEHLATLTSRYPLMEVLTAEQLQPFEQAAYDQAAAEGKPIQPGPLGTRDLRERMAALATAAWEAKFGVKIPARVAATGTASAQPSPADTARTQPTAAEREAKLRLAGNHPPDIAQTGSGNIGGEPTDAQAEAALMGNEDEAIRWMQANQGYVQKQVGAKVRLR